MRAIILIFVLLLSFQSFAQVKDWSSLPKKTTRPTRGEIIYKDSLTYYRLPLNLLPRSGGGGGMTQADKDSINLALNEKVDKEAGSGLYPDADAQRVATMWDRDVYVATQVVQKADTENAPWEVWTTQNYSNTVANSTATVNRQAFTIANDGMVRTVTVTMTAKDASNNTYVHRRIASFVNNGGTVSRLTYTEAIPKAATGTLATCDFNIVASGATAVVTTNGNGVAFTWKATILIE